jgi:D-lactate dehydrogenase
MTFTGPTWGGRGREVVRNMKVLLFDTHPFERDAFEAANTPPTHALHYTEVRLSAETAALAQGFEAVCAFVNDRLDAAALGKLKDLGVKLIALRSAGYNHVDLVEADRLGLPVVRVPEYSPYAVAEHAVALVLALNRKIHRAYSRVREWNFSLAGLVGFDLHGKTVGVIGTGRIGRVAARIFKGFGCRVIAYDQYPNDEMVQESGVVYRPLPELFAESDIITLHIPLTPETRHLIDAAALARMKRGVTLINTGRGALIDSKALIDALKTGHIGAAGLDVYEEEEGIFFQDLSGQVLQDDVLARLLTFPNVIVTAHQAFLTTEALSNIAHTTLSNVTAFAEGASLDNQVHAHKVLR